MFVKKIIVGDNYTNCYLAGEENGEGIIIDPGANPDKIKEALDQVGMKITKIINTHGHFDHIGANEVLKEGTNAPILIHKSEKDFLTDPDKNLSDYLSEFQRVVSPAPDDLLEDGDEIEAGNNILKVLHTPGHSPGSVSLYNQDENILFCGDTLFQMGIGRTDFPGCDEEKIYDSIENILFNLPEETVVFSGHGQSTTIKEFKVNIWQRFKR